MTWVVLALVAVVVAGVALTAALAGRARRERNARLEIVPGVASRAPVAWAGAHTPEAKLHRRLGDAVRSMRAQPALAGAVYLQQRGALEQEALRLHDRLIAVAALAGPQRSGAIEQVAGLVERFEAVVADLVIASLDDTASLDAVISESELRLRALEQARAEVEQADGGPM
jgi:hypothetical protein